MDLVYRLKEIKWPSDVYDKEATETVEELRKLTKQLVIDVLNEVLDNGHDLGGMGEYGRGWNDAKVQTKMIVKEMMRRWQM